MQSFELSNQVKNRHIPITASGFSIAEVEALENP
jgi:hypothetical protein